MIYINRKLVCKVIPEKFEGTIPAGMKAGEIYPVMGYKVETKKANDRIPFDHEEISIFMVLNGGRIAYCYPSTLEVFIDPVESGAGIPASAAGNNQHG